MEAAAELRLDARLVAESAITAQTAVPQGGPYEFEGNRAPRAVGGLGEGAFWHASLADRAVPVVVPGAPERARFWRVVSRDVAPAGLPAALLVCVFYAPHRGLGSEGRSAFLRQLRGAFDAACAEHRLPLLAMGDLNMPEIRCLQPGG